MLLQPALEYWQNPESSAFRGRISFTGVFIPTDISWSSQLVSLEDRLLDPAQVRLFTSAIFSIHICRSFVAALRERVQPTEPRPISFRRELLSDEDIASIARHLIEIWHLSDTFPSLSAIHSALGKRLVYIDNLVTRESILGPEGRTERLAGELSLRIQFPVSLQSAIDVANEALKEPDGKWALLFDELELAPEWIQDRLLPLLRSTDHRMIFKLALSPYVFTQALREVTAPAASQDYDAIQLWFGDKDDADLLSFCHKIWEGALAADGNAGVRAEWALGRSKFDTGRVSWKEANTSYHPDSPMAAEFRELAVKDKSFKKYVKDHDLEPEIWPNIDGKERARYIRKIQHVVIARNYFRGIRKQRSRKSRELYTGASSLFAVSEGNPRILKSIIASLLAAWKDRSLPIQRRLQSDAMNEAAERFEALLATVPVARLNSASYSPSIIDLLTKIASYLHKVAIEHDFQEEPPGSFFVDSSLDRGTVEALRSGLNMGAVILVPGGRQKVVGELQGARLRLSYLLAMHHDCLVRLGRAINLSAMLPRARYAASREQLTFLGGDDDGI
jgi:hypothetical protein